MLVPIITEAHPEDLEVAFHTKVGSKKMKKKEKEEKKIKEVAKKEKEIELLEKKLRQAEAISFSKVEPY